MILSFSTRYILDCVISKNKTHSSIYPVENDRIIVYNLYGLLKIKVSLPKTFIKDQKVLSACMKVPQLLKKNT